MGRIEGIHVAVTKRMKRNHVDLKKPVSRRTQKTCVATALWESKLDSGGLRNPHVSVTVA